MLFTEPRFFVFFVTLFILYWRIKGNDARKNLILVASYVFYGAWDYRFAIMVFVLSSADYFFAAGIHSSTDAVVRKRFVCCSVAMNLLVLGIFKYLNFFIASTVAAANLMHLRVDQPTLHIILPVGVSFFTFQSLSYTIDVYRREIEPARGLRDYLLFSSFFPQLVAGPIVRPRYFLPQLDACRTVGPADVRAAMLLFAVGLAKKTAIADNLSAYVDRVFADPRLFDIPSSITAVWLYATQIYCDFSGYSDMAIAVAALLGYRLTLNFDAPYLATSIQDFWRRWHISLSSWIRDYIYISLGGRSGNVLKTYRNLLVTMLAGGLWHGASWTFVAWGGAHGGGQIIHQEYRRIGDRSVQGRLLRSLYWFLTLNFVCLCWILFRAGSFGDASLLIRRYLLLAPGGPEALPGWLAALPPTLLAVQYLLRRFDVFGRIVDVNLFLFALFMGAFGALILSLLPFGYKPFIYFQF